MNAAYSSEDVALFMRSRADSGEEILTCLGFFPQEQLRPMISRGEARFLKDQKTGERRVILSAAAPALLRVRAMSSSSGTRALSTTYTEDLYPDSPAQLAHKRKHEIPVTVTHTVISLKKYRGPGIGFVPYGPEERFARRRWNPDAIRPMFWSARAAEAALRPQQQPPQA